MCLAPYRQTGEPWARAERASVGGLGAPRPPRPALVGGGGGHTHTDTLQGHVLHTTGVPGAHTHMQKYKDEK